MNSSERAGISHFANKMKNLLPLATLVIFATLLLISSVSAFDSPSPSPSPTPTPNPAIDALGCDNKCALRCSSSGWKDRCLKYCGICCGKCQGCVPNGPYANKAQCPCYRDLKNPKGRDKCP